MTMANGETTRALAVRQGDIFTADGFATMMKIAETLVRSGVLPRAIDTPMKAFAIMQKGREIGVGPMRALTGIALIEGKPTVSPELKLELFRQRGGRVKWVKSDNTVAHLQLKAPNGDEHEEIVTIEDMTRAGVVSKDNWRKYPKSMLRARATGFGLRALGEGDGSYTPDELGAVTDEEGNAVEYIPPPKAERGPVSIDSSSTGSSTGPSTDIDDGAQAKGSPRRQSAAQVPPTGGPITPDQVTLIHTLRAKIPSLSSDELYRKLLGVYRKEDKTRAASSKDLSRHQASHLIDRFHEKIRKQQEAFEGMEAQAADNISAIMAHAKSGPKPIPANLDDALDANFTSATEENQWIDQTLGFIDRTEIPVEMHTEVIGLLLARTLGDGAYHQALEAFQRRRA